MRYYISTIALCLGLGPNLLAQKSDTLHRQLRIQTHEATTLEERLPGELRWVAPSQPKPKSLTLAPSSLAKYAYSPTLNPLQGLSRLSPYYDKSTQKGYISLGAGLKYNAYLSGGVRLINNEEQELDLALDGRYTQYSNKIKGLDFKNKEEGLGVSAQYRQRFKGHSHWGLKGSFRHQKHNYLGYTDLEKLDDHTAELLGKPTLSSQQAKLEFELDQLQSNEALPYYIKPYIQYTHAKGLSVEEQSLGRGELNLGLTGQFAHYFSLAHSVGLDLKGEAFIYNHSGEELTERNPFFPDIPSIESYSNRSIIRLAPYWSYEGKRDQMSWQVKLGLGLDLYQGLEQKGIQLSPKVDALLRFNPAWSLGLKVQGEVEANSMSQMLSQMPYLRIGANSHLTRKPIEGELRLQGLLSPATELVAQLGYTQYKDGLNFLASGTSDPNRHWANPYLFTALDQQNAFSPEKADGSVWTIGASLSHRFAGQLVAKVGAKYNMWSKEHIADKLPALYGRPELEMEAELVYRPLQSLELILGYELQHGAKQMVIRPDSGHIESLPTHSFFRFSAAYQLTKQFSLGAHAHALTSSEATRFYGYREQLFSATLSASYKF